MATSDRQGRTRMCSVVFLDIAGFTQQSVTRQVNVKSHLEELITRALADVPETDLVIRRHWRRRCIRRLRKCCRKGPRDNGFSRHAGIDRRSA